MLSCRWLDYLRELNMASLLLRLTLVSVLGGLIGMERERKRLPAGFRTYMLVCIGSALAMILSQYITVMQSGAWAEASVAVGNRTDVSRFGAQVISGVGFLGASTILITNRQEVRGLPTAAGLWASACMGLAVGAGLYECAVVGFLLILLSMFVLPRIENAVRVKARNMMFYVEFYTVEDITSIIRASKALGIRIFEVDFDKGKLASGIYNPNAVFTVGLPVGMTHVSAMSELSRIENIRVIEEL